MKGSTGVFVIGLTLGAIASLIAYKLIKSSDEPGLGALSERIQENLSELELRIREVLKAEA